MARLVGQAPHLPSLLAPNALTQAVADVQHLRPRSATREIKPKKVENKPETEISTGGAITST